MNKLTLLFAALLLAGCTHASTQTQAPPAAPVVVVANVPAPVPTPEAKPEAPDTTPVAHQAPFKGQTWTLTDATGQWIGMENDDDGMIALNPAVGAKLILVSESPEKSLTALTTRVSKTLASHGVKVLSTKPVKVSGVAGSQLTTKQGGLTVLVSLFLTKTNSYLFGCAGLTDNKQVGDACKDIRNQLSFKQ